MENEKKRIKKVIKIALSIAAVVGIAVLIKFTGIHENLRLENIQNFKIWLNQFGATGPIIFIIIYIATCLLLLPVFPLFIFGAVAFGPVMGTVWSSVGTTLGATAAFLMARYTARGMVEKWIKGNNNFIRIDEGVKKQGWRMLMLTRLFPFFPFGLQNFAYGLTKIKILTYILISWSCMLPVIIIYNIMADSILKGDGNLKNLLIYLGVGAGLIVFITFVPKWFRKRKK